MRISRVHHPVTVLGEGTRAGIWVQGCSLRCTGCVSADTWEPADGDDLAIDDLVAWLEALGEVDGLTVSGGEPFDQAEQLAELLAKVRLLRPFRDGKADVLVYSGYHSARLRRWHPDVLQHVDAVVSGPYVARRAGSMSLRGSDNQEIVLLTDLGRERYGELPAERPGELQLDVHDDTAWLVGIPRDGFFEDLAVRLAERGVTASWSSQP